MDWAVKSPPIDIASIGDLKPLEILYEFDGPRIFLSEVAAGEVLCFLADDDGKHFRFIASPTNKNIIDKLKNGLQTLRDTLNQPWVWFIDLTYDGIPQAAWKGTLADAPEDVLPEKGLMLWPHLEPIFALRAIGDGLSEGNVPISVIRQVIEGATTSLKKIANSVFEESKRQGRKANTIRQFYDLPTLGFAYNSFEAAFRVPETQQSPLSLTESEEVVAVFSKIGEKLETAFDWALDEKTRQASGPLPIELLEALEKLIPPKTGIVRSIEVRGKFFPNPVARYCLTRETSNTVRKALVAARASQERIVKVQGLVREFDKDNFSFSLRNTDDGKEHSCLFPPEFFDDLIEAFNNDGRVTISGRENIKTGEIEVSLVSRDNPSA